MADGQGPVALDLGHPGRCRLHGTYRAATGGGPHRTWSREVANKGIEDGPGSLEDARGERGGRLGRDAARDKGWGVKTASGRYVGGIMCRSEQLS